MKRQIRWKLNIGELYLCFFIMCIGVFEIGHLAGVFLKLPLSVCGTIILPLLLLSAGIMVICLIGGIRKQCGIRNRADGSAGAGGCRNRKRSEMGVFFLFLAVLAWQIWYICMSDMLQIPGDITMETVNSFLAENGIYKVSPLTGKPYDGPPLRYEILCLPTVYALCCRWTGASAELLIDNIVPTVVLCTSYAAYYCLSGTLFGQEKENYGKRMCFMLLLAVALTSCESAVYMEGYGILHGGHLGTSIRNSILVPFVLYASLERKWFMAVMCILAEMCLVWTLWGAGVCLLLTAVTVLLGRLLKLPGVKKRIWTADEGESV